MYTSSSKFLTKFKQERSHDVKRLLKVLIWLMAAVAILVLAVIIAFTVSVKPSVFLIQRLFDQPVIIHDEARYEAAVLKIDKLADIPYTSTSNENSLNIYYPKGRDEALPILFWLHGGGYVGGNNDGVEEFATYIAASNQIAVVAMNYEKAPALQYPGQVKQVDEMYQFISTHAEDYPMLDFSTVFFGGDSAGAQIAGQYVALQTNEAYAAEMEMTQTVPISSIHGFISYSGPVDLQQMASIQSDDKFMKFFVNTVARALIGTKDWKNSHEIRQASIPNYITENFPPTYITDGNAFSFQEQGMALVEKLQSLNIPVEALFFKDVEKEIVHEYQFDYSMDEAKESLQQTIDFIDGQLKR
jgi:acetyl esterase/lipase